MAKDLEWLVGELVTNAVVHGRAGRGSRVTVTYRLVGDLLRVDVRDTATGLPRPARWPAGGDDTAEGGRGMLIVAAVAHRWGVAPRVIGKSVWFEFRLAPTEACARELEEIPPKD